MKKLLMLPLIAAAFCAPPLAFADSFATSVDVKQAAALQTEGTLLLDVREPGEFAEVHAKDAVLIPLGQLQSRLRPRRLSWTGSAFLKMGLRVMQTSGASVPTGCVILY